MAFGKRAQTASVTTLLSTSRKGRGHIRGRGAHRVYTFAPTARPSPKFRRGQRKHLCRPPSKDGQHRLFRRCKATSLTIPYHTTQWTSFGAFIVSYLSLRGQHCACPFNRLRLIYAGAMFPSQYSPFTGRALAHRSRSFFVPRSLCGAALLAALSGSFGHLCASRNAQVPLRYTSQPFRRKSAPSRSLKATWFCLSNRFFSSIIMLLILPFASNASLDSDG